MLFRSPEEMRKVITSAVLTGKPLLVLDNITRAFGDQALDSYLTSPAHEDRLLGTNQTTSARSWMLIFASANNTAFAGDMGRRVLPIRLESRLENPENRTDFAHPNLLAWVRENRFRLVRSALIILRAWHVAGRPCLDAEGQPLPLWGSFESWSQIIPACLTWLGMPDPMLARRGIASAADATKDALATLLECWEQMDPGGYGMTVSKVIRDLFPQGRAEPSASDPANREILFVRQPSEHLATWEGEKLSKERASAISGIARVRWLSELPAALHVLMCESDRVYLNANEHERSAAEVDPRDLRMARQVMARYPLHRYERLAPIMRRLRAIKDRTEVDLIRRAVDVTDAGLRRMLAAVRPGVMEYELEAELIYEFTRQR